MVEPRSKVVALMVASMALGAPRSAEAQGWPEGGGGSIGVGFDFDDGDIATGLALALLPALAAVGGIGSIATIAGNSTQLQPNDDPALRRVRAWSIAALAIGAIGTIGGGIACGLLAATPVYGDFEYDVPAVWAVAISGTMLSSVAIVLGSINLSRWSNAQKKARASSAEAWWVKPALLSTRDRGVAPSLAVGLSF